MSDALTFNPAVYDLWVFRRDAAGVRYLLLHASQLKADRHFSGGRFWQVPSGVVGQGESIPAAVDRNLAQYGLTVAGIWQAELTYPIYNRRFHELQMITVFAVETSDSAVSLNPDEHADFAWLDFDMAMTRVHYRGLRDGLRSVREYVTGVVPAAELRLR